MKTNIYRILMDQKRRLDFYAQSDESAIKFYTWYNQGNNSVMKLARNGEIIFT